MIDILEESILKVKTISKKKYIIKLLFHNHVDELLIQYLLDIHKINLLKDFYNIYNNERTINYHKIYHILKHTLFVVHIYQNLYNTKVYEEMQ